MVFVTEPCWRLDRFVNEIHSPSAGERKREITFSISAKETAHGWPDDNQLNVLPKKSETVDVDTHHISQHTPARRALRIGLTQDPVIIQFVEFSALFF